MYARGETGKQRVEEFSIWLGDNELRALHTDAVSEITLSLRFFYFADKVSEPKLRDGRLYFVAIAQLSLAPDRVALPCHLEMTVLGPEVDLLLPLSSGRLGAMKQASIASAKSRAIRAAAGYDSGSRIASCNEFQ